MNEVLTSLTENVINRRTKFDANKKDHLVEFAYFRKHGKWKESCPFYLERPYRDIISMCQAKYSDNLFERLKK